jgi:alkaline phosphatase
MTRVWSSRHGSTPVLAGVATVVVAVLGLAACTSAAGSPTPPPAPASSSAAPAPGGRRVIFVNGDGMAAAQREAGRLSIAGLDGDLEMDKLPTAGLLTTDSRDPAAFVTDSAAAATTWATGQKTYNGAISVDVNKAPLETLGTQAKAAGKATGLVTTAQVTDASPAAFFSRTPDRKAPDEIARQYLDESKPDVILGGGEDWWYPAGTAGTFPDTPPEDPEETSKGTKGNLVDRARQLGYAYAGDAAALQQASGPKLLGLFANEELFQQKPEGQGDVYAPVVDLPTMTRKALDTLSASPQGFFLFVEEEAVDEFGHNNNGPKVLQAMGQLDSTVALLRQYVAQHPETLLVVTGDHECGGLTVEGVAADDETGTGDSIEDGPFPIKGSDKQFVMDWTTEEHTDVPVPVTAEGPGAEALTGQHPNTYVHQVLTRALNL